MAEILRISGCVHTASATCTVATLDATLLALLTSFNEAHPQAYIDATGHQLVGLGSDQLLVSLLINFSFARNMANELHPTLQHLNNQHEVQMEWMQSSTLVDSEGN